MSEAVGTHSNRLSPGLMNRVDPHSGEIPGINGPKHRGVLSDKQGSYCAWLSHPRAIPKWQSGDTDQDQCRRPCERQRTPRLVTLLRFHVWIAVWLQRMWPCPIHGLRYRLSRTTLCVCVGGGETDPSTRGGIKVHGTKIWCAYAPLNAQQPMKENPGQGSHYFIPPSPLPLPRAKNAKDV